MGAAVARVAFAVALATNMLWTAAVMKCVHLFPLAKETKEGYCLMLTQIAWQLAIFFSPWIRCVAAEDYLDQWGLALDAMVDAEAESRASGSPPKPLFIMGNHTSFFDTILVVAKFPKQVLWKCRTYMNWTLFKMPLLGTVCRCVGHFPVYFKSAEDGAFKVDATRMEQVEKDVDSHLERGGWLSFYPEGQINKSPETLMSFRFGGMKRALAADAHIVTMVFRGNPTVWPVKEQVGGFPGEVRYSLRNVAPDGCKALVQAARAEGVKEEKDLPDYAVLAKRLQEIMQEQYNVLGEPSLKAARGKGGKGQ